MIAAHPATYSASLEWLAPSAAVLRLHPGPDGRLGDPYVWACTVRRLGPTAILKGVCAPLPGSRAAQAVCRALRDAGFTRRAHERIEGGEVRLVAKEL